MRSILHMEINPVLRRTMLNTQDMRSELRIGLYEILCLRWIIGQIQEQTHVVHGAVLLKVRLEESRRLHVHLKTE